jgi:putative SOS response-associated peptidase YedK
MCGRFTLKTPVLEWLIHFFPQFGDHWTQATRALFEQAPKLALPRWNIAPTQEVLVLASTVPGEPPLLLAMRWGLIPSWASGTNIGYSMINARSETLAEKPSFRSLLPQHRCVVLADGYYEWKKSPDDGTKQKKTPFWIHRPQEAPLAMAGLWTSNRRVVPASDWLTTTIITADANDDTRGVHDRMPVFLDEGIPIQRWLNLELEPDEWPLFWAPRTGGCLELRKVSDRVNSPKNEGISLLEDLEHSPSSME